MSDTTPIVFVADNEISIRESLESLIRSCGWRPETFACAQDFLDRRSADCPSCLVLEVALPDVNGLELQKRMAIERPDVPIIFLTGYGDVSKAVQAMKAGAVEFLTKPFSAAYLSTAIRNAIERSRLLLLGERELCPMRCHYASLTSREREVMALVVAGLLNKQIAGKLGISEITVKAHRGHMMRKMNADSLAGLVNIAAMLHLARSSETRFHLSRG